MSRIFLLSFIFATCSTCLVRPWFWKGVKNRYLLNDNGCRIGFSNNNWKSEVKTQILFFVGIFLLSFLQYTLLGVRQNLYGSLNIVILCLFLQCVWDYQGRLNTSILYISISFFVILFLQDISAGNSIKVPFNTSSFTISTQSSQKEANAEEHFTFTEEEIKSTFKFPFVSTPTYNNGKRIYLVSDRIDTNGVVIVSNDNQAKAIFVPFCTDLGIQNIRREYPTDKIQNLYITVSDTNTPYALFALANKTSLFGSYEIDKYLLVNLATGTIQEHTQEQLPDFVTKI